MEEDIGHHHGLKEGRTDGFFPCLFSVMSIYLSAGRLLVLHRQIAPENDKWAEKKEEGVGRETDEWTNVQCTVEVTTRRRRRISKIDISTLTFLINKST